MILPPATYFERTYEQTTTISVKESFAHKTERLIRSSFGSGADDALALCERESGCRYDAVNQQSGACGIGQALPCGKMPCKLTAAEIDCQVRWFHSYIAARYNNASIALMNWNMNKEAFGQGWY